MNNDQKRISFLHRIVRETRNSPTTHPYDASYIERTIDDLSRAITEATQETIKLDTGDFQIEITPDTAHGFFEHYELGDGWGGGLWFDGKRLTDYDGVFELPKEVTAALIAAGYDMSYVTDGEDDSDAG